MELERELMAEHSGQQKARGDPVTKTQSEGALMASQLSSAQRNMARPPSADNLWSPDSSRSGSPLSASKKDKINAARNQRMTDAALINERSISRRSLSPGGSRGITRRSVSRSPTRNSSNRDGKRTPSREIPSARSSTGATEVAMSVDEKIQETDRVKVAAIKADEHR